MPRTHIPALISSETPANGSMSATQHTDKKNVFSAQRKIIRLRLTRPFP